VVNADCASGVCLSNGTCAAAPGSEDEGAEGSFGEAEGSGQDSADDGGEAAGDGGVDEGDESAADGESTSDGPGEDEGPEGASEGDEAAGTDEGGSGVCSPNKDGIITRAEMPIAVGLSTTYAAAQDVEVDNEGTDGPNGARVWDFAGELPQDQKELVEALPIDGFWFAPDFPSADYVAPLSKFDEFLGIFRIEEGALLMIGIASNDDGFFTKTNLSYDPPVPVLEFPLERDSAWSVDTSVTGTLKGVIANYTESYAMEVDAFGSVSTPFSEFEVLRVNTWLEQKQLGVTYNSARTYLYVTECFGTVVSVRSQYLDDTAEFSDAGEIRRLSP
jgi:hypothetical protein